MEYAVLTNLPYQSINAWIKTKPASGLGQPTTTRPCMASAIIDSSISKYNIEDQRLNPMSVAPAAGAWVAGLTAEWEGDKDHDQTSTIIFSAYPCTQLLAGIHGDVIAQSSRSCPGSFSVPRDGNECLRTGCRYQ